MAPDDPTGGFDEETAYAEQLRPAWSPQELLAVAAAGAFVVAVAADVVEAILLGPGPSSALAVARACAWGTPDWVIVLLVGLGAIWWHAERLVSTTGEGEVGEPAPDAAYDHEHRLLRAGTAVRILLFAFLGTIVSSALYAAFSLATAPRAHASWVPYIADVLVVALLSSAGTVATLHLRALCTSSLQGERRQGER